MGPGNRVTCVFNLLHNLQGLGVSPPTLGANNMIVDLRVINLIFPPTTFRVVVSVINPTYDVRNLLINKTPTIKHTKGPQTMELGTPLTVKWSSHLTLRDRWVGLEIHILAALLPTLNGRLGLVSLPQFSSVDWFDVGQAATSFLCSILRTLTSSSSLYLG